MIDAYFYFKLQIIVLYRKILCLNCILTKNVHLVTFVVKCIKHFNCTQFASI